MKARSQNVTAYCICCCGRARVRVLGPTAWKVELICHRCNVKRCSAAETFHLDCDQPNVDACLRAHGCKSRVANVDGKTVRLPILRYQGRR